jgi:anti-sigma regulatory factor (Ser/Thr protein kinase)
MGEPTSTAARVETSEFVHELAGASPPAGTPRAEVRRWLAPFARPGDAGDDLVLAVSEAASTSIEHAYTPPSVDDAVKLTFWTEPRAICLEIVDHGHWRTPPEQTTGRGQGIEIMQRLVAFVLIHQEDHAHRTARGRCSPGPSASAASLRLNDMDPDSTTAQKMLALLRYVDGDLDDDATYAAMSKEIGAGGRALSDPPDGSGPDSWLDAKARVISALRPLTPKDAVRGQYEGYREVDGVDPTSTVETYVAIRLALDSWRWADVPLLIRAGKTLPVTATEVSIRFKPVPYDVFGVGAHGLANTLRFRIWPDAEIGLTLAGKKPGAGRVPELQELAFAQQPGSDMRPYDRLIGAALDGHRVLFARQDTVEAAWRVVDPILDDAVPVHPYPRDTWGPTEADALLPHNHTWHDPVD